MSKNAVAIDDADSIRRFIASMNNVNQNTGTSGSSSSGQAPSERSLNTLTDNEKVSDELGASLPDKSATVVTPLKPSGHTSIFEQSPESHPSPQISGLQAPHNTPKTRPSSPRTAPKQTHCEDVNDAIFDYVQNVKGVPLSDSMWAPYKHGVYKPSLLSGPRSGARDLTPSKVVHVNPAINDSFARMSFKAADADVHGGERVLSSSNSKSRRSKPTTISESAPTYESLRAGEDTITAEGSSIVATLGNVESSDPAQPVAKENATQPSPNTAMVPPHLRTKHDPSWSSGKVLSEQMKGSTDHVLSKETLGSQSHLPSLASSTSGGLPAKTSENESPGQLSKTTTITSNATKDNELTSTKIFGGVAHKPGKTSANVVGNEGLDNDERESLLKHLSLLQKSRVLSSEQLKMLKAIENQLHPTPPIPASAYRPVEPSWSPSTSANEAEPANALSRSTKSPGLMERIASASPNDLATQKEATSGKSLPIPTSSSSKEPENLEKALYFKAWPRSEERDRPAAKIRKVIVKELPRGASPTFVASLVYGGPLEQIQIRNETSAAVLFLDAEDCMNYYNATSNGIVYKKDIHGHELVVFIELAKDVDVVGGLLRGWIDSGVTRCIRAVGVDEHWDEEDLMKIASRKNRKVEGIDDGKNYGNARSVIFRFCKIEDAVQFKAALSRDEEWEHCNIHYAADPCAVARGVHFGKS